MSDLDPRSADSHHVLRDGSAELWDQMRYRIAYEPGGLYLFAKGVMLYPDLSHRTHMPLCLFLEDESHLSKLVEYPRRHLKTTIVTVSYTLWRFARAVARGEDPIERIAIVSSTKPNAMRFLRQIKTQVERNSVFQTFFPELIPDMNEDIWNMEEITFPRQRVRDAPSVDTFGAGTKATSRHYDGIIEDDMINEENWDSEKAIDKAISLHQLTENLLEDVDNSWRITNENCWVQYDLNHHIIESEPQTAVFSCGSSTGLNDHRSRLLSPRVKELTDQWNDGETMWPNRFHHRALATIREKVGNFIYNAHYENNPFDADTVDFKSSWLGYWEATKTKPSPGRRSEFAVRLLPKVRRGPTGDIETATPMVVVPISELQLSAAWDIATGAKTTKDRNAFVVTGIDSHNRVIVLETLVRKCDPLVFIEDMFECIVKWGLTTVGIEVVAFQKILMQLLPRLLDDWNTRPENAHWDRQIGFGFFREVRPGTGRSKEARIRFLVSVPFQQEKVFVQTTQSEFLDEYTHFPNGKTDDVLDAFAYTAEFWRTGISDEEEIEEDDADIERLLARNPTTGY
jgi:hypothetical protein